MQSLTVIENLKIVENVGFGLSSTTVSTMMNELHFDGRFLQGVSKVDIAKIIVETMRDAGNFTVTNSTMFR